MSTSIKTSYSARIAIPSTILNTLANGAAARLAAILNAGPSGPQYLDAAVTFAINLQNSGSFAGAKVINVYAYGGDGTWFSSNQGSTDSGVTLESPNDLVQCATRDVGAGLIVVGGVAIGYIPSIAAVFNGILPPYWGLIFENQTGINFASAHDLAYIGVQAQGV